MQTVLCELWVMVDESGGYEVSKDASELQASPGECCRMVKVTVSVPRPQPVELVATIDPEPAATGLKVA